MNWSVKESAFQIWHHVKILARGLLRVLYGAAVAGLLGLAAYGFAAIPSEGGYVAVCDFMVAMATLFIALTCMYALGGKQKKKSRFSSYE